MSLTTLKEVERLSTICNACRYCEGFCAVFQAMVLRRTFTNQDLTYFANLCHNCRDCYYACQYAPPHEFDLNFPKAMGQLRVETYEEFTWPNAFSGAFKKNGWLTAIVTLISVLLVLGFALGHTGSQGLFTAYTGADSFYQIIPYNWMVVPAMLLVGLMGLILIKGGMTCWRESGGSDNGRIQFFNMNHHIQAVKDVLILKYLDGGGFGCNYPNEQFSMVRRWFHHCVFYGFGLCFASTTVAAIYDHLFHWPAPYALFSLPVILGTLGGISLMVGVVALLYLKLKMDKAPALPRAMGMDVGFTILLLLTTLSGLVLMLLRTTPLMGLCLSLHLGFVMAFFITLPYGKFVHGIYRYLALVRHAAEQAAHRE